AYIKQFAHSANDEGTLKAHERALADLQDKLRHVIGPVSIKGFSGRGTISLDSLDDGDEGFGRLDGLMFGEDPDKPQVLVTTANLFDAWLRAHEDFWKESPLPRAMQAALKRDDFYTQAINNGAAVLTYAEIPVARPAWATLAFAVLDGRTQSDPPRIPDEIIITVRSADRVFVVTAKTAVKAGPIAACDAEHAKRARDADVAGEADQKAGAKDAALHAKAEELGRKVDAAYPDCYAAQAPSAAFFSALVKQVQGLIDALPGR
ncbi:MAG TPA: hypothetical protein VGG01_00815, partial [Xanthobacteraceae bacterium]